MVRKRTTTFTHGTGCYTCESCKRKTRDDGNGDSVGLRLCTQCYEVGGLENQISDHGRDPIAYARNCGETIEETQARIVELRAEIVKRGGRVE